MFLKRIQFLLISICLFLAPRSIDYVFLFLICEFRNTLRTFQWNLSIDHSIKRWQEHFMKVGLAFVSEQIFNNHFEEEYEMMKVAFLWYICYTLLINIVVSLLPSDPLRVIFLIIQCPEDLIH